MNILIACEESQRECLAFRAKGHRAFSCDLQECSGGHPSYHIVGDVLPLLNGDCDFQTQDGLFHIQVGRWDLIIAHPPCTYLSIAGQQCFSPKKGSRASKKSKTTALWYISHLSKAKYSGANLLVIRKTYRTLKDSCFTDLKWAVNRLGLQGVWVAKENPLEITNVKTGQKILFRGLDDALKITSITVEVGYLCWAWIEEAYEIFDETDFDMIDESIRGEIPAPLFKQITITFNPWNERHFLKHRFFDEVTGYDAAGKPIYRERKTDISEDGEILAMTTNYTCNEFLDAADLKVFENMKKNNPRRYAVAGLGGWGITDGLVYENWK